MWGELGAAWSGCILTEYETTNKEQRKCGRSHTSAHPPSRPRIILDPPQCRTALLAQSFARPLDRAHRAQEIARGDFRQYAFGKAAPDQFGEEIGKASDMFEPERLRAAEEIRADADMVDSSGGDEIDDVVGELLERRARRRAALRPGRDQGPCAG